jgi:short-subunit dehydrogenase
MAPNPLKGLATLIVDPYAAVAYWQRALRLPNPGEGSLPEAVAGKRVVVTGASSGIGRNAAERIAKAGGEVILVARRREQLELVAEGITKAGGIAAVHTADLSSPPDVERVAQEVIEAHDGVDILVNNAGHSIRRWISDSYERPRDFEVTINLNYLAPVRLVLAFLPGMRERRHGHILNVSTLGVLAGPPRFSAYLASKAALDMFTRSIASEVIGDGVHATTIYMPLVRTPMIEPTAAYDSVPALSVDEAAHMVTRAIVNRPREVTPLPGMASRMMYPLAPKAADRLVGGVLRLLEDRG